MLLKSTAGPDPLCKPTVSWASRAPAWPRAGQRGLRGRDSSLCPALCLRVGLSRPGIQCQHHSHWACLGVSIDALYGKSGINVPAHCLPGLPWVWREMAPAMLSCLCSGAGCHSSDGRYGTKGGRHTRSAVSALCRGLYTCLASFYLHLTVQLRGRLLGSRCLWLPQQPPTSIRSNLHPEAMVSGDGVLGR